MKLRKFYKTLPVLLTIIVPVNVQLSAQLIQPIEDSKNILPLRERVRITYKWWMWKYENVLPMVMREQGIEMWIIRDDEADLYYNNHKLHYNTLYAFEPHTRVAVPGWEHGFELGIGQIAAFTEDGLQYLYRQQETDWHVRT